MSDEKSALIRALNDSLRTTFLGGRVVMTSGVQMLPEDQLTKLLTAVRAFKDFDEENDPHEEHDFGSILQDGVKFFWKIDYFDRQLVYGSEDPSQPEITTRVLTLMLAEEY